MVSSWDLYLTYICRDSISKLEHTHKYQSWGSGHVFWGPLFNSLKPCVQVSFQKAPVPFWKGTASSSPGIFLLVFQTRCRDSTKLFVGAGMIGFHFSHILWRHGNLWMLPLFSWPCLLDLTFHDLQKRHPPFNCPISLFLVLQSSFRMFLYPTGECLKTASHSPIYWMLSIKTESLAPRGGVGLGQAHIDHDYTGLRHWPGELSIEEKEQVRIFPRK